MKEKDTFRTFAKAALRFLGLGSSSTSPAGEHKLVSANAGFAFKLLQQLIKEQPGVNLFVSPFSASSVLQIACNGAAGRTKAQMQAALGIAGLPPEAVNGCNKEIAKSLNGRGTNMVLTTANAIWYRKGTPVKPQFMACSQEFFGATMDGLDFDDPRSAEIMNAWAREKTHGRINAIADGPIDPLTELFLANAVYFKGKWGVPFDVESTKERVFHLRATGQTNTPMMEQTRTFPYRRGTGYQAVRLDYQGWSLGMYVFLPDSGSSPEKLLSMMSGDSWQRVTQPGFTETEGTLVLPKFKLEYGAELNGALKALGIKAAFEKADFSGISNRPLFISKVRQQAFVEVNEEGTEAAAATLMEIPLGIAANPPKLFEMIVDRPFLFLIEDKETPTILFMGVVFDPGLSAHAFAR